jgi:hypothetical protein
LRRSGKTKPDTAPTDTYKEHVDKRTGEVKQIPLGIDPGFEYTPGQSAIQYKSLNFIEKWPENSAPIPIGFGQKPELPTASIITQDDLLVDGLTDQAYVQAFMAQFEGQSELYKDVLGEPLLISDELFKNNKGELKVSKNGVRHRYLKLLANALKEPDEVWGLLEPDFNRPGKYRLKRRYIKRWIIEETEQPVHGFSAFEYGQGAWTGSTIFVPFKRKGKQKIPARDAYLEAQRAGILLYSLVNNDEG